MFESGGQLSLPNSPQKKDGGDVKSEPQKVKISVKIAARFARYLARQHNSLKGLDSGKNIQVKLVIVFRNGSSWARWSFFFKMVVLSQISRSWLITVVHSRNCPSWSKFSFLVKMVFLGQNRCFWSRGLFLVETDASGQNSHLWFKQLFLVKTVISCHKSHFTQNSPFWSK